MRDELRERIFEIVIGREHSGDPRRTLYQEQADAILDAFQAFMRKHGLKMMARPPTHEIHWSDKETLHVQHVAYDWWAVAPLTPWSVLEGKEEKGSRE